MLSSFHLYFPSISSFNLENLPSDLPSSKLQNWKIFLQIFQFPCLQPGKSSFYLPSSNLENLPSTFHLPTWKIFLLPSIFLPSFKPGKSSFYIFQASNLETLPSTFRLPSFQPGKASFQASNLKNLPSELPTSKSSTWKIFLQTFHLPYIFPVYLISPYALLVLGHQGQCPHLCRNPP